MSAIESAIARVLVRLHEEVRRTLSASTVDQARVLGKNPKGDRQRGFDVAADMAARCFLEQEIAYTEIAALPAKVVDAALLEIERESE